VRAVAAKGKPGQAEPTDRFVITAFGQDQPGIVRRFSEYLAGKDINIVDLYGDRRGEDFVLIGQVEVPMHWDIRMMQADLEQMGSELGFTVKLQHENIFVATNQLRLTRGPA
jgi:glycine cleavage system transcriptional repressor